jgi:hypothetical protein
VDWRTADKVSIAAGRQCGRQRTNGAFLWLPDPSPRRDGPIWLNPGIEGEE